MDKPAPILIDNAEEWEAEDILDYSFQNNRHEFLVHWKGYEWAHNTWEPIENLEHSLELIQEYCNTNHPTEPTPKISSHYVKAVWEPMEYLLQPVKPAKHPMISGNPMTMGNMTRAALKLITSLSTMMTYYGTRSTARRAMRIGREFDISK